VTVEGNVPDVPIIAISQLGDTRIIIPDAIMREEHANFIVNFRKRKTLCSYISRLAER
jgi:hypothetical protein